MHLDEQPLPAGNVAATDADHPSRSGAATSEHPRSKPGVDLWGEVTEWITAFTMDPDDRLVGVGRVGDEQQLVTRGCIAERLAPTAEYGAVNRGAERRVLRTYRVLEHAGVPRDNAGATHNLPKSLPTFNAAEGKRFS